MRAEAIFVAGYASALLAGAAGLHRLGRAARSLQARVDRTEGQDQGWPHSEVPRFHTGIALVAAGAATLLPAGELLVGGNSPGETAVLTIVTVLAVLTLGWLVTRLH